jgi:outer membrane protein assembly factor BamB
MPRRLLIAVLLILAGSHPALTAEELPKLQPLPPLELDLGAASTTIVAPAAAEYAKIAQRLRRDLAAAVGHPPRIVADTLSPQDLGAGPILVLGNVMDSQLARKLYAGAYDFTDYSWPSAGGHVVRTIRDPFATGAHVIMLGGSDAAGVADAAAALVVLVQQRGGRLGYVNRVKLGRWAALIQGYTAAILRDKDETWRRTGYSGSWEYQIEIAKAAIGYLRTGEEAYLPLFARELRYWFDHDVFHPRSDATQMLHGFLNTILIPWALVRDHPFFTPPQRQQLDADFLAVFSSAEGPGRIDSESRHHQIRGNHSTRTGLDAFFGGRYFTRRFGYEPARRWTEIADRFFAQQMQCGKPNEDSWGHQWAASMFNTAVYFLAAGKDEYFQSEGFRRAADRALIAYDAGSAPLGYMAACALGSGDTGYLSGYAGGEALVRRCAAMGGLGDEYLRSFSTGRPITPRADLLDVAIAPLDRLWYETIDGGRKQAGLFVNTEPLTACFDKISIRESWAGNQYYLLLDGLSGGGHSYQDANCLVRYAERGLQWATDTYQADASATVRAQNGVYVAIDAAGPGRLHRFARKLYAGQSGPYMAIASALEGLGDVDWQRHVVRRRGAWTLVIDRALAKRPGELLAERHWHLNGQITPRPDGLVSQAGSQHRCLHLQTVGVAADGMHGTRDRVELVRGPATPERPLEIATLLSVNTNAQTADVRLARGAIGWRVQSSDGVEVLVPNTAGEAGVSILTPHENAVIGAAPARALPPYEQASRVAESLAEGGLSVHPKFPPLSLPWLVMPVGRRAVTAIARADDGRWAAGDAGGQVVLFAPGGSRRAAAQFPSSILSLRFLGNDLLVGEDRGAITRLAGDGTQRWQRVIPWVSMAWSNWSEGRSRIREISTADVHGDGHAVILLANSDRRVYALSGHGQELWKASVTWGVYTAMTVGQYHGAFALLGGTSRPSIFGHCVLFGADGQMLTHYARPDLISWSNPSQFRDLRLADLDGDGKPEAICAVDTDCRQLVVYRGDGRLLWDADVAGAAEALAVAPATAARGPVVYCGSASGYVCGFDGRTGHRRFASFVGEPTNFVASLADGRVIAAAATGKVFVLDAEGSVAGCDVLDHGVTGLLRPGEDRSANAVALGTDDGRLLVLK